MLLFLYLTVNFNIEIELTTVPNRGKALKKSWKASMNILIWSKELSIHICSNALSNEVFSHYQFYINYLTIEHN